MDGVKRETASMTSGEAQYLAALKSANKTRLARSALKRQLKARQVSILKALSEPCVQSATLYEILMAQYRWGEATTLAFFARLAARGVPIGMTRLVSELTERQLDALREALR